MYPELNGVSRDLSCFCSTKKDLNCTCFNTQHFSFGQNIPMPAQPADNQENPQPMEVEKFVHPDVGQWCILKYDDDLYPGIVLDTDETSVQVKCMHRVGPN